MKEDIQHLKNTYLIISLLSFIFSLTQICFCTTVNCSDSIEILIIGFFGLITGGACITWLANPLLLIAWIYLKKRPKQSIIFSGLAFIFSISFLFFDKILANEAGHYLEITQYRLGYWLWLFSSLIMLIGNLHLKFSLSQST